MRVDRLSGRRDPREAALRALAGAARRCVQGLHARRARRGADLAEAGLCERGNIPGFYKRSDAFLLGCRRSRPRPPRRPKDPEEIPSRARCASPSPASAGPDDGGAGADGAHHRGGQAQPSRTAPTALPPREDRCRRGGRRTQGRGRGAPERARAHGVRAVRQRRPSELLRGDRARGLRALRVHRVSGVLQQRVPRALAVPANARREGRAPPRRSVRSATSSWPTESSAASRSLRATTSPSPRRSCKTAFAAPACCTSTCSCGGERKDAIVWSRKLSNPADD